MRMQSAAFGVAVLLALATAARAADGPEADPATRGAWSISLPASVDVGLKDRTDAVARVTIGLLDELRKAKISAAPRPESLRVFEKRGQKWVEVPSGVYRDPESTDMYELVWQMPGKNAMLTEREYQLCFTPAGQDAAWRRPPEWRKLAPPSPSRNLVKNGSAERLDPKDPSKPKHWRGAASVDMRNAFHGKQSLRLDATSRKGAPQWWSSRFPMKPKAQYLVSFAVRCDIKEGLHPIAWVYWLDRSGKRVSREITVYRVGIRYSGKPKEWRSVEQTVAPPRGTAYGQVCLMLYRTVGTGWFDKLAVTPFERRDAVRVTLGKRDAPF